MNLKQSYRFSLDAALPDHDELMVFLDSVPRGSRAAVIRKMLLHALREQDFLLRVCRQQRMPVALEQLRGLEKAMAGLVTAIGDVQRSSLACQAGCDEEAMP